MRSIGQGVPHGDGDRFNLSRADRYDVRYREVGGSWEEWEDVGLATSHTVIGLEADTEYEFRIRTVEGTETSTEVSATAETPPPPLSTLETPTGVTAAVTSVSAISVTWNRVTGASRYLVRRKEGRDGSWGPEAEAVSPMIFTGLSLATEYCFGVQARSASAQSEWSGEACATTWGAAPDNLRVTGISGDSVDLAWDASPGATGYRVTRAGAGTAVAGTTQTIGSLVRGGTHEFTVAALFDGVSSPESGILTVTTADPRAPVAAPVASAGDGEIRLSWAAGSGAGAWSGPGGSGTQELEYAVERRTPPGAGTWGEIASGLSATEYVDAAVAAGLNYEYRVFTTTATLGGPVKSPAGPAVAVMVRPPDPVPPENLMGIVTSPTSVRLSWDGVAEADRYDLERMWMDDRVKQVLQLPDAATSYEDTRLLTGQEYMYRVRSVAVRSGTDYPSAWSAAVAVTPSADPPELTVEAVSAVRLDVFWTAAPAATGYDLEWRTDGTDWASLVSGTELRYEHVGLTPGTTYRYRLRVRVGSGASAVLSEWSNPASGTTEALAVPENLMAMGVSPTSVSLRWEAVAEADRYDLERMRMDDRVKQVLQLPDAETGYEDTHLLTGQEYMYRVRSVVVRSGTDYPSAWSAAVVVTPSADPPELSVAVVSAARLAVSWTAVPGAAEYELEWSPDGADWASLVSGTELRYEHDGLTPGTTYWYRVRARVGSGASELLTEWSESVSETTPAPAAPGNLLAVGSSATSVSLSWDGVAEADRYDLERMRMDDRVKQVLQLPDAATGYEDTHLLTGQEYMYRVRSVVVRSGTDHPSVWSAAVVVTPSADPVELAVSAVSAVRLAVSWTAVPGAAEYELEWSPDGADWASLVSGTALGYEHDGLTPGTTYWYRVRARVGSGASQVLTAWSEPASETTPAPAAPGNLLAVGSSATSVSLSWDGVAEADRYDLERMRMDDRVKQVLQLPDAATGYEDTGLLTGQEYTYRVRSVVVRSGTDYSSAWSDSVAVLPRLVPPQNVTATAPDAVTVELTWDAAPGADGYRLRWKAGRDDWTVEAEDLREATYRHEGRDPATEYSYQVLSYVGTEESDWSSRAEVMTPELPAPAGVEASVTATAVTVTWSEVAVADGYRVWRQEMAGGASRATSISGTEFRDTEVTLGVAYTYYVETVLERSGGNIHSSASATVTATPALQPPANLTATAASATAITLEWEASEGAAGYELRWRRGEGAWSEALAAGSGTSYRHEGLDQATEYSYEVRAVSGIHVSDWSDSATAATIEDTGPLVPEGLSLAADSPFAVTAAWDEVSEAERYELRWREDGTGTWESLEVTGESQENTELAPETTYEYAVRSVRGTRTSAWSDTVEVTTPAFTAPGSFRATATGAATVELSWREAPGTGVTYRVRWRLPGERWTNREDVTESSYTVTGLTADTLYEFRVWAFRFSDGERHRTDAVDAEARTAAE